MFNDDWLDITDKHSMMKQLLFIDCQSLLFSIIQYLQTNMLGDQFPTTEP